MASPYMAHIFTICCDFENIEFSILALSVLSVISLTLLFSGGEPDLRWSNIDDTESNICWIIVTDIVWYDGWQMTPMEIKRRKTDIGEWIKCLPEHIIMLCQAYMGLIYRSKFWQTKIFGGQNFQWTKFFGKKDFRQLAIFCGTTYIQ